MKWQRKINGVHVLTIAKVIEVQVYRNSFGACWYIMFGRKSPITYKTMREAKKAAIEYCKTVCGNALTEINKVEKS